MTPEPNIQEYDGGHVNIVEEDGDVLAYEVEQIDGEWVATGEVWQSDGAGEWVQLIEKDEVKRTPVE